MAAGHVGVEAVERGLTILSAFQEGAQDLSLAEISRRTGLYKSTILRIAASLEAMRFLARGPDGVFRLGPELWRLGSLYRRSFDLGEYVRPVLRGLVAETRETASFYVRDGDQRICLYRMNSPRAARHHLDEGVRLPLDRGAAGRVLLAGARDAPAAAPRAEARHESGTPARAGLAISRGERDPEVGAVAVPVIDAAGHLRGALSVSTLLTRLTAETEAAIGEALVAGTRRLTATLPVGD